MNRYYGVLLLLCVGIILSTVSVSGAYPTHNEITSQVDPVYVEFGSSDNSIIYISAETDIIQGSSSIISSIVYIDANETFNNSRLTLSDKFQSIEPSHYNFTEDSFDETYYQTSWNLSPSSTTTYTVELSINGREIYSTPITINVSPKQVAYRNVTEYTVQSSTTAESNDDLRELLSSKNISYSPLELNKSIERANEIVSVSKKVKIITTTYDDNTSTTNTSVTLTVTPKSDSDKEIVRIIETIPKSFASNTSELSFNIEPTILQYDPVIMWETDPSVEQTYTYTASGAKDVTGNTIAVSSSTGSGQSNTLKIILALLLIPIVGGIIVFFGKYSPENK